MGEILINDAYRRLAIRLDTLPNGFPPTDDGIELALLAHLFTPEEADLAAKLSLTAQTPAELATALGEDPKTLRVMLKNMAKKGLLEVKKIDTGLGYALMPFVVGFYENQRPLDETLAQLVEAYFKRTFMKVLEVEPQLHRVIPIGETIPVGIEVQPFESAAAILSQAKAWGVIDCICRQQKALIGEACGHPIEVCLIYSSIPGVFDHADDVRALTYEEALATLRMAADAGLVHTVGNHQAEENGYICNCCTCSCGILRGVAELGMANVVARAAFVSRIDADLCISCENCADYCQFDALALDETGIMAVEQRRCVGCGQCVLHCEQGAIELVRRPEDEIKPVPATLREWQIERAAARGQNFADIL